MYVTVLLCPQLAVVNLHPRWMACAVAFFQTSLTNPCHSGSDISLHRSGSDRGWYTDQVSAGSKWSCLPISDPLAKCVGLVSSKTAQAGRVIQRRPQLLPLPLDFCSDFLSILQMKTKLTVYQGLASCAAFTGSVWVEYVWWWVHGGSSLVFWHRTQQQMQTTQLRDALSLGSLSRSLTPQTPSSHPFPTSQSFPRSITSLGGITWGVCVCVRVFGLCNHVSTCEQEGKREKKKRFLLNVPFEQLWVERSGVNPSFPFSLWIELACKALKIVEGPIICRIRSAFPSFISSICNAIFCKGFFPLSDIKQPWFEIFVSKLCSDTKAQVTGQKSCKKTSSYRRASFTGSAELKDATPLTALNSKAQRRYNCHRDLFRFTPTLTQFGEIYWIFCSMWMLLPQRKSGGCVLRKSEIIVILMIVT